MSKFAGIISGIVVIPSIIVIIVGLSNNRIYKNKTCKFLLASRKS